MRLSPALLAALASLALGCHPRPVVTPSSIRFQPTGMVSARPIQSAGSAEAVFDAQHVVSPRVDLTLGPDGRWSGTVDGHAGVLEVGPDRIAGPGVDLRFRDAGGVLSVDGELGGRSVRAALSSRGLAGYSDGGYCGFDFLPLGRDTYRGAYSCPPTGPGHRGVPSAEVRVLGEAASPEPPMPQTALALVSVLPPY